MKKTDSDLKPCQRPKGAAELFPLKHAAEEQKGASVFVLFCFLMSGSFVAKKFLRQEDKGVEKNKNKKNPAIVELSSLKFDMPVSSAQLRPVKIRAARSMG